MSDCCSSRIVYKLLVLIKFSNLLLNRMNSQTWWTCSNWPKCQWKIPIKYISPLLLSPGIIGSTHVVPTTQQQQQQFDLFPHYYMTREYSHGCRIWLITWIRFFILASFFQLESQLSNELTFYFIKQSSQLMCRSFVLLKKVSLLARWPTR